MTQTGLATLSFSGAGGKLVFNRDLGLDTKDLDSGLGPRDLPASLSQTKDNICGWRDNKTTLTNRVGGEGRKRRPKPMTLGKSSEG